VNAIELQEAQRRLGQSDEELAASLGVSPDTVRAWAAGRATVPRRHGQQIEWLAAGAEREAALRSSGLPECAWMHEHVAEPFPDDPDAALKHPEAGEQHAEVCRVCVAREQFLAERFGPMPPLPQSAWMRLFAWVERVPSWARPAAVGAAILGAVVSLRVVFAIPLLISAPAKFGEALLAVAAAAGAGAVGGFAYSLSRPALRRLGRLGDYLTGIVCVFAYMGALAVVAPLAFGERVIEDQTSLTIFVVVSVFFGLVMGHTWFRGQSAM
jgi:DNA-binding transcriptional regulator YdaS (Cro superfamily)